MRSAKVSSFRSRLSSLVDSRYGNFFIKQLYVFGSTHLGHNRQGTLHYKQTQYIHQHHDHSYSLQVHLHYITNTSSASTNGCYNSLQSKATHRELSVDRTRFFAKQMLTADALLHQKNKQTMRLQYSIS